MTRRAAFGRELDIAADRQMHAVARRRLRQADGEAAALRRFHVLVAQHEPAPTALPYGLGDGFDRLPGLAAVGDDNEPGRQSSHEPPLMSRPGPVAGSTARRGRGAGCAPPETRGARL